MGYGIVWIITREYEFVDAFETEEEAEWYKDDKATEILQRELDEAGIDDPTEEDIEEASILAGFNGDCYEMECVDISGLGEDEEIHLANGDSLEIEEIIDALKKRKKSKEEKKFEESMENYLLRNVEYYKVCDLEA